MIENGCQHATSGRGRFDVHEVQPRVADHDIDHGRHKQVWVWQCDLVRHFEHGGRGSGPSEKEDLRDTRLTLDRWAVDTAGTIKCIVWTPMYKAMRTHAAGSHGRHKRGNSLTSCPLGP